uniref:(northern house mosquito) hypothetical protein n=1 Tax=Culex pipiens TaxID=7175 RepID=A0A8D8CZH5_CULPI
MIQVVLLIYLSSLPRTHDGNQKFYLQYILRNKLENLGQIPSVLVVAQLNLVTRGRRRHRLSTSAATASAANRRSRRRRSARCTTSCCCCYRYASIRGRSLGRKLRGHLAR